MESTTVASNAVSVKKLAHKLGIAPTDKIRDFFEDLYVPRPGLETELEIKLRSSRFFAVIGPAVSGKTQVVRKGLLEHLEDSKEEGVTGINGDQWMIVNTQPEADPINNLARDIFNQLKKKKDGDQEAIKTLLTQSSRGLLNVYDQHIVRDQAERFNLLLVIDNVEDLFRYKALIKEEAQLTAEEDDRSQDVAYLNLLMNAVREEHQQRARADRKAIYVLLLLDQAYLNELVDFPEVHELVNDNRLFVPPFAADLMLSVLDQNWKKALGRSANDPLSLKNDERELGYKLKKDLEAELLKASPMNIPQVLFEFQFTLSLLDKQQGGYLELSEAYVNMGQVNQTFNQYVRERYQELSPQQKFICERMFKTLTLFDSNHAGKSDFAPFSRPTLKSKLCAICQGSQWKESPFPELRNQKAQVASAIPTDYLDKQDVEEGIDTIIHKFNEIFPMIREVKFGHDEIIDLGRVIFLTDWEQLRDWVIAENEGASVYSKIVDSAQDYFQSWRVESPTKTAIEDGELGAATKTIQRQNEAIKISRAEIEKANQNIRKAEENKLEALKKLAKIEKERIATQAQLDSENQNSGSSRGGDEINTDQENLRKEYSELNEEIKRNTNEIDLAHQQIRTANTEISRASVLIEQIASEEELAALLKAEKKSWSSYIKDFRLTEIKSLVFRLFCKDQRRLQEAKTLDRPTDLYLYDEIQNAYNFWRNTLPNPAWAQQYFPLKVSKQQKADELSNKNSKAGRAPVWEDFLHEKLTSFDLVEKFLRLSDAENWRREGREKRRQEAEANCFRKITRIATIFSIFALIASVVAVIFFLNAKNSENNLRLTNFVDVLLKARIISESNLNVDQAAIDDANPVLLRAVKDQIKGPKTKDIYMVIDTLVQYDYVAFAPPRDSVEIPGLPHPERYTDLSKDALALIEQLDRQELSIRKGIGKTSFEKGWFFTGKQTVSYTEINDFLQDSINQTAYLQGPYVYYCLLEHIRAYRRIILAKGDREARNKVKRDHFSLDAQVVSVASNPLVMDQFSVGDRKGMVCIFEQFPDRFFLISADSEEEKVPLAGEITALGYTHDGDYLIAGTSLGRLYYCPNVSTPAGRELYWRLLATPGNGPIRQLCVGNAAEENHLLVGTDTELLFTRLNIDTDAEVLSLSSNLQLLLNRPQGGIYGMGANHDGDTVIVGGGNQTMIYHLPSGDGGLPQLLKVIEHPGINITAAGISHQTHLHRIDTITAGPTVALGSESGRLWLVPMNELLRSNFLSIEWEEGAYHKSTITNLAFNDDLPQMVSASLDGAIRFWNMELVCLRKQQNLGSQFDWFDHLRVENAKEGVFGAFFVNKDQLISVHSTSLHLWKTNPDALIEEANHLYRIQAQMYRKD